MSPYKTLGMLLLSVGATGLTACGGSDSPAPPVAKNLSCDDTMKTAFKPDAQTTVVLVKAFKKNDPIILSGAATAETPIAPNDLCMVKLNVGPGNPGPTGAPSTSAGIGIEVWLPAPANWNDRIHAHGGGGWQGGNAGSATAIDLYFSLTLIDTAGNEGAVSSLTDTGHAAGDGSFAMNPDGTINTSLWTDFASRGIHEQAVKTKALATAYYGRAPKFSYWDGGSTGGRQGLNLAQNNPGDFDGIIALYPAINWTKFITAELYPQLVFQRDLNGTPLTTDQQDLVSNAAIAACDVVGGQHLGYILDPAACKYDPTTDPSVLCVANGGTNATPACVSPTQAAAMNKIWYGMTADGSVPAPATDSGWAITPTGQQRWYGLTRGTSLYGGAFGGFGLTGAGPFSIASDQVALSLQNPTLATPAFKNATGNGADGWKALSYAQLSNAFDRGIALQPQFGNINTDNPDLSAFKARNGKMITWHGLNDELIMPQGSINYYNRVMTQLGGLTNVQSFYRLYLVPGVGHGSPNGTSNPTANPPLPGGEIYKALTDWVEKGIAPDRIDITSPSPAPVQKSQPICVYPKKATFTSGDPFAAVSYTCQ